jgi:hypothetical protein
MTSRPTRRWGPVLAGGLVLTGFLIAAGPARGETGRDPAPGVESRPELRGGADRDLDRLVALYEGMKPAQAAAVLEQLDPELSTRILLGMRARQAAKVLASLSPKRAADLTTRMIRARPARAVSSEGAR